ncbi:MAG: class I SAM-dependent methyltransferase, partial [Actinobacteria bacterium]|nr:class I SAM-dependent methyltransferase [Actinomycetota bacterium]
MDTINDNRSSPDFAGQVNRMFDRVAGRYDALNEVMTAGMHHRWRERAAEVDAGLVLEQRVCTPALDRDRGLAHPPGVRVGH